MYFVEKFVHFIEEPGIPTFMQLDAQIWDNWLLRQKGVVGKQIMIDIDKPYIVTVQVTWYSRDFLMNLDQDEIAEAEAAMQEGMSEFAFELLKKDFYYAKTTIENGAIDDDGDEDDNDNIDGADGYNPMEDEPQEVPMNDYNLVV